MKYEVGDKVRNKSKELYKNNKVGWNWNDEMLKDIDHCCYYIPIRFGELWLILDDRYKKIINTEFYSTREEAEDEIRSRRQS